MEPGTKRRAADSADARDDKRHKVSMTPLTDVEKAYSDHVTDQEAMEDSTWQCQHWTSLDRTWRQWHLGDL